jgi:hypothetical protein
MRSLRVTSILALAVGLVSAPAVADDRAIAQQAFQEGRDLMAAGNYAEACPKFAAAAQLSQTAGVRLNLAECYAKLGKTASAWAKANEALSIADRAGDAAAASVAHQQMSALGPKLCHLTIVVERDTAPPGLEIALDGEKIPAAVWGTALPVDPGPHEVTATAPGHQRASTKATLTGDAAQATVTVPSLAAALDGSAAPPPATDAVAPAAESSGGWSRSTAHTLALVSGGLGVVGLGIGTAFGLDASSKKSQYQQHEAGGHCIDPQCATISQSALSSATVSTIGFVAGGVLVAAGAVLWLTAPTGPAQDAQGGGIAIVTTAGPQGVHAGISGSF